MKLVIAQMKHETNTFSPVPTPLARFAAGRKHPTEGRDAYDAHKGTGTGVGAFIDLAEQADAEVVIPIAANAAPSGPVEDAAYEYVAGRIVDAVAAGCDAVLLDLHGAMITQSLDDGEGELLRRLRAVNPRVPIAVALDMHTNLFPDMAARCTTLAGYQTYPHVDMYETALRAGKPLLAAVRGEVRPMVSSGHRPMLPHVMRQSSLDSPNRELQQRCREMERQGALAATVFVGFPHADIPYAGLSAVVVTDNDRRQAERWRDELLELAWSQREAFVYAVEPLQQSLARAAAMTNGPIVLLDHYDNCASGGTMDTMTVLGGILDAALEDVVAFAVYDPAAVEAMKAAGLGATVTLDLGGKLDMPSIGLKGQPRRVTGAVARITDGLYTNEGPMGRGMLMDMGPTAVLDIGKVQIVVISRQVEPHDLACFKSLGIDPAAKRYVMLKSRVHWRAGLGGLAKAVVECAGTGVCTSDYSTLKFNRVRRPIFPLDTEAFRDGLP
ncbi:MAG: M81 family peptidase [Dehalococcoidia bacterium]|nr:M81 family peptidase [Dehalococcoidia bacterium]